LTDVLHLHNLQLSIECSMVMSIIEQQMNFLVDQVTPHSNGI